MHCMYGYTVGYLTDSTPLHQEKPPLDSCRHCLPGDTVWVYPTERGVGLTKDTTTMPLLILHALRSSSYYDPSRYPPRSCIAAHYTNTRPHHHHHASSASPNQHCAEPNFHYHVASRRSAPTDPTPLMNPRQLVYLLLNILQQPRIMASSSNKEHVVTPPQEGTSVEVSTESSSEPTDGSSLRRSFRECCIRHLKTTTPFVEN